MNLFAATCHIHYAKSARLCVQEMRKFVEEYHTVRRSERQWAGLWTDIVFEQVQIRSLKSGGGLTRGRGMIDKLVLQFMMP